MYDLACKFRAHKPAQNCVNVIHTQLFQRFIQVQVFAVVVARPISFLGL